MHRISLPRAPAQVVPMPEELLRSIAGELLKTDGIHKPPATIEWE